MRRRAIHDRAEAESLDSEEKRTVGSLTGRNIADLFGYAARFPVFLLFCCASLLRSPCSAPPPPARVKGRRRASRSSNYSFHHEAGEDVNSDGGIRTGLNAKRRRLRRRGASRRGRGRGRGRPALQLAARASVPVISSGTGPSASCTATRPAQHVPRSGDGAGGSPSANSDGSRSRRCRTSTSARTRPAADATAPGGRHRGRRTAQKRNRAGGCRSEEGYAAATPPRTHSGRSGKRRTSRHRPLVSPRVRSRARPANSC